MTISRWTNWKNLPRAIARGDRRQKLVRLLDRADPDKCGERENRPIIRAHIGIAAEHHRADNSKAIEKLADAEAFEIVSLAPDQTSQELLAKFIRGEEDPEQVSGRSGWRADPHSRMI